jgi:hypothetical protein
MKKISFLLCVTILSLFVSCNKVQDPVNDTVPCDTTYVTGNVVDENGDTVAATFNSRFDLNSFQELGRKGEIDSMRQMVDGHRIQLTANLVAHFPKLTNPDSIHFELWSGKVKKVQSGDGKTYDGEITCQLVFRIKDAKAKVDTVIFLACGNGMLSNVNELVQEGLSRIDFGVAAPWLIVVERGKGIAHYIDQLDQWAPVCKNARIPLKDENGNSISPERAMKEMHGLITTSLFPNDTIDLVHMKVKNRFGEVQFQRRALETQKANQRIADAAKNKAKTEATKTKTRKK